MVVRLTGKGLVLIDGQKWATHRSIINPAFSMDKLKDMVKLMATCTMSILDGWNHQATEAKDNSVKLEMNTEFQKVTADVISRTAFGSSYIQGREAFRAQRELQKYSAAANINVFIPGSQYLPTPSNIQAWKLDRKVKNKIKQIIRSRMKSHATNSDPSYGDDLLGLIIGASEHKESSSPKLSMDEIMEECKTFFFAGHETTSSLLTWTAFLLSLHQDWQEKLREEVLRECGMEIPDADMLSKLKLVNMVLLEVMRLYCPAIELNREVLQDIKVGNLMVPKNTCLTIPIIKIHRSKQHWGEDANEFNPFRFKDGITKAATHPNAFLGFGMGPRVCIGQNFAKLEAKTVLTLVLQRFSLTLSSEYKHAPINYITLQPQYGLPIIIKPLHP
ncbi:hypothetical protein K2173_005099 [Erythroxylum novogranatense]|uniref:Cytochrome P450 n=1 Tax=Erythroxylum novogranatense TaxID=1862640 RepID=A0AAV8UBE4_9ROSI|nr:hypothetical protein K2173_005099 [Erythroxylum novogranatense]